MMMCRTVCSIVGRNVVTHRSYGRTAGTVGIWWLKGKVNALTMSYAPLLTLLVKVNAATMLLVKR